MALDWTAEQNTLLNMKKIIEKAWRMNSRQLRFCCRGLRHRQQELLPGRLGNAFLVYLEQIADTADGGHGVKNWPELFSDTGQLIQLISRYGHLGKEKWICVLPKLEEHQENYFKTKIGLMFVLTLKEKLGLSEENCSGAVHLKNSCPYESEKPCAAGTGTDGKDDKDELERLAAWVMQDSHHKCCGVSSKRMHNNSAVFMYLKQHGLFSKHMHNSAVFMHPKLHGPSADRMHNSVVFIFASLSVCFMTAWLYGQIARNQNTWNAHQMKVSASQKEDISMNADLQDALEYNPQAYETDRADKSVPGHQNTQLQDLSLKKTPGEKQKEDSKTPDQAAGSSGHKKRPKILKQYQHIAQEYPGLFGWLQIPGTQIDQPVMQPFKEKEYYLDHDFTGSDSVEGALFADPLNSCWPLDDNTIVYGHNMKNGHMFGSLDLYEDAAFFQAHREIRFDTVYETGRYEAVAVFKTRILNENEQGFRYYQFFSYNSREEFQKCLDFVKENQLFDSGCFMEYGDQILMLSTCEYSQENGRLVVVARKCR